MPDQINPVALGIQVPDSFKPIGEMISNASALRNYQRQGLALQQEKALLQPNIEKGQAESRTAQIGANLAQFRFKGEQVQKARDIATGLQADPDFQNGNAAGMIPKIAEARQRMIDSGIPPAMAEVQAAHLMTMAAQDPKNVRQVLLNTIRGGQTAESQAAVANAPLTPVPTGKTIQPTQLQPGAAPVPGAPPIGQAIPVTVSPTEAQTATTDALGRPAIAVKSPQGAISYQPPQGANYRPMMTLPAGETPQTAGPLFVLRDQAQQAAAQAPNEHFNNQQILKLTPAAFTGTGSGELAKVLNSVGLQQTNDAGADTARLQHFLALQMENNAKSQGANTDQARTLAAQAVLPGGSPADAIKNITKINDAYVTGKELFNKGIVAAINNPKNTKDIFAVRDFQNAWSQNFDPNVMRLINADKSGDKAELAAISKELGPQGMKALLPKYRAIKALTTTGQYGQP